MKRCLLVSVALSALAVAASAQVPAGGEFRVNTDTTDSQNNTRAAMEPDGDFVVVWNETSQTGYDWGIFGQRFAASGARRGSEFQINSYTTGFQGLPAVAVGSRGDFIVVWESAHGGSVWDIQGRRFDAVGGAIGSEFQVNTYTPGQQYRPRIGRAADGRFVVSWTSHTGDGSGYTILARRFDPSGNPVGGDFVVNTYTTDKQRFADVAVQADGSFIVVWEEDENDRDGSFNSIFGQRFDASGARVGSDFQVNTYTPLDQRFPSIGVSAGGSFVVAWTSELGDGSEYGVRARRFDASGNALGPDFVVNTYTTGSQSSVAGQVALDALGNFVISWSGPGDGSPTYLSNQASFAQRFSASGARRGGEFRVNSFTTNQQYRSSAVSDAVGNFAVTWQSLDQDGDSFGVFAQRYGGLGPAALAVDSPGNGVLEPGETVAMRPSWRNFNGAAQTFSGTLTDITGPVGATYAITDGVGDYGTVANGATAPCADCYAVSVSNPSIRPATHWDAAAVESILPDTQGQQKQWLLHVGRSFNDVAPSSGFYRFIEALLHNSITGGCTSTTYCPLSPTTRQQMGVFVLVAKEELGYLPPACGATPMFADIPTSSAFCRWIEEIARRGVVTGCGGGDFCPFSAATREQMAVFVLRTLDPALVPPPCTTPIYNDVPAGSGFCRWIEELTRRSVVTGCGGGNYCPTAAVTREQMGVFISATFGLTLYGP